MSLLEKMFSTKAKRQWFPKNRLSILGSDNFINRRFFNEDDFTKIVLETTILRWFRENRLRMVVIPRQFV